MSASSDTPDEPQRETPDDSAAVAGRLDDETIRRRGSAAMFYVLSWGFANLVITFFGSVVLARLLSQRDFGLIAVGQTVATLASTVAEGGIASGFIRQSEGIALSVLRSINGFQFVITLAFAAVLTPIALQFGLAGAVTALMLWSMPIASPQIAGRVVLGRELRFRAIAIVEAVGVLAYYAWAIAGVVAGYGVWSLASGTVVRAGMSTLAVGGIVSWRLLVPSLARYRDVLAVIGFGIRFSLFNLTNVLYDQGKNIVIAAFGGTAALGLWVLAGRLLQVPYLMYQPINRVAFPAFSQFVASGRDPRPVLERVVRLSFAASTLVLPAFLVAVPGVITSLFGAKWDDAALIFPGVIISFFIGVPVGSVCIQFLFAVGRPSYVLRVAVITSALNLAAIAVLMWIIGTSGIGFGTIPGAAVESILLARLVHQLTGARLFASMPAFSVASALAAAAGFVVGTVVGQDFLGAFLAGTTAVAVSAVVCAATSRSVVADLLSVGRRSVSTAIAEGQ